MRHRFFIGADQLRDHLVTFSSEQWHQIHTVLRLRTGDTVRVFNGVEATDHVVEIDRDATGRVVGTRAQAQEPRTRLVVYPALLQRDKFEAVLQKLTELGVAAIAPVITARTLIREPPDAHRQTRWRSILREAAEQSGRGVIPELHAAVPFSRAMETAAASGTVVMAYEAERRRTLPAALVDATPTVSLFVGPEGGYEPNEAAAAEAAGAQLITLGPRVLRTETASPVLAALVLYELEQRR